MGKMIRSMAAVIAAVLAAAVPCRAQTCVSGTITDAHDGTVLDGATVSIKDSEFKTTTDAGGNFSICPQGGTPIRNAGGFQAGSHMTGLYEHGYSLYDMTGRRVTGPVTNGIYLSRQTLNGKSYLNRVVVTGGNILNRTGSSAPVITKSLKTAATDVVIEAESMTFNGYKVDTGYKLAGKGIMVTTHPGTGEATATFGGASGNYQVALTVVPENDGNPTIKVYLNDQEIISETFPLGSHELTDRVDFCNWGLQVNTGDKIKIVGTTDHLESPDKAAFARVDKITFSPMAGKEVSLFIEKEGYQPQTITAALGDAGISVKLDTLPGSGDAPWTIPYVTGIGVPTVKVNLPEGKLGPRTTKAIDPLTVGGISLKSGVWSIGRDWDELKEGGYLDFGDKGRIMLNGRKLLGFKMTVPVMTKDVAVIKGPGEAGYFEGTNPTRRPISKFLQGAHFHHYICRGVNGDGGQDGSNSHSIHHDGYIEMAPDHATNTAGKHYDGYQVHTYSGGSASIDIRRVVIEWNRAGTIGATNAALFTQMSGAGATVRDLLILNPAGTYFLIKLGGGGPHNVDRIQMIGERGPNSVTPSSTAPIALVSITNGTPKFTLYNDVPGARDWK